MKSVLLFISILLLAPLFASANVVGEWTFSGAGCRDDDLSASSHVSKPIFSGEAGITGSLLTLNADKSASMTTVMNGETVNNTGTYVLDGRSVVINGGEFQLESVDNRLLVVGTASETENICDNNGKYVYVLGQVD